MISDDMNNKLTIFEIEKKQAEILLKEQIRSIRSTLDSLEYKLNNNEKLYESDGFQFNAIQVEVCLSKLALYNTTIDLLKNYLEKENNSKKNKL